MARNPSAMCIHKCNDSKQTKKTRKKMAMIPKMVYHKRVQRDTYRHTVKNVTCVQITFHLAFLKFNKSFRLQGFSKPLITFNNFSEGKFNLVNPICEFLKKIFSFRTYPLIIFPTHSLPPLPPQNILKVETWPGSCL